MRSSVGTDEFGGVDGARLDRRKDVTAGERHLFTAEVVEHLAGDSGDTHRQALDIRDRVDLLGEPSTHLHPGVPGRELDDAEFGGVELSHQLEATPFVEPCVLLTRGQTERHRGAELGRRVDTGVVVRRGVAGVGTAVADRRQHLETTDDLSGRADVDTETAAGEA